MKNELTLQKDNDRRISAGAAAALFAINQTICFPPVNMTRSQVGAVIVSKGLAAYFGGNHVAIHNKNARGKIVGARLAIVTGNFGDWLPSGTQPQPDKATTRGVRADGTVVIHNSKNKILSETKSDKATADYWAVIPKAEYTALCTVEENY